MLIKLFYRDESLEFKTENQQPFGIIIVVVVIVILFVQSYCYYES